MKRKITEGHISIDRDDLKKIALRNLDNRSAVTQEIISRKPDFIEKWALYIFLGILLLLFAGTWFIRYPVIIKTRATLTANNSLKEIIPLQTGKLIKIFPEGGAVVKQNDIIGWIESSANAKETLQLSYLLDSSSALLKYGKVEKIPQLFKENFRNLGDLQSAYKTYITALREFARYLGFRQEQNKQEIIFEQALQAFKRIVDEWKHRFILTAPISGTFCFSLPIQQNQYVEEGKPFAYIEHETIHPYAQVFLPQKNLGNLDTGMVVQLRFDAYPFAEVGFVKGKLSYISRTVSESGCLATIELVNGLQTNLNKEIKFKNGLKAEALIIIKSMRLLERLHYGIVKATNSEML